MTGQVHAAGSEEPAPGGPLFAAWQSSRTSWLQSWVAIKKRQSFF